MKRFLLALIAVGAIAASCMARDEYVRDASVLPAPARTTLSQAFKAKVSLIKIDRELFDKDYEVILTDGTEVTFDDKGNWKDVEVPAGKAVPDKFVPEATRRWVKQNHPGMKVVSIERDGRGYDVELTNGVDAKFNADGSFRKYD